MANFRTPQLMNVGIKAIRGLTSAEAAYSSLIVGAGIWLASEAESPYVSLRPGEEVTTLVSLENIPADANFTRITAALIPKKDGAQAKQREHQSVVAEDGGQPRIYDVAVNVPTSPTNLTLRLENGDIFWNFTNTLTATQYKLPDLAEEVNAFLDRVQETKGKVDTPVELPFLIQSSSTGQVKIVISAISYSRLKTESWLNDLDGTMRVDRNIQLDFAVIQKIPLEPLIAAPGQPIILREIRMDIGGEFSSDRLLGNVVKHDGQAYATVSTDYALAQGFRLPNPVQCTGLSGLFVPESEAELYLEIQNDNNGSPVVTNPLTQATLSLSMPQPGVNNKWTFTNFETPVSLQADVPYWLIIKGIRGKVLVALQIQEDTYMTTMFVNRGGQSWKRFGPLDPMQLPLFRLVYLPEVDNQTAPITLRLKDMPIRQPIDPGPEVQSISLQIPEDKIQAELVIESQARGTLSIANVVQEYAPK